MRCYLVNLPSTLFFCCGMEVTRSVVFERTSYNPSYSDILQFSPHMLPPFPFDTNAYICSVAPCLRVLWMSTHGCFAPSFPLSILDCCDQAMESRSQTPLSTTSTTTLEVPTTTCSPLAATRSSLGGSQAGGPRLFRSVSQFVQAFLRKTCLTYVCTQILLLPLSRL